MAEVIQFPGRSRPEPIRKEARPAAAPASMPAEEGVLNRIPVGRFQSILPDVTDAMQPIEAFIAACQFYAIGGQDQGRRAKAALAKFQQLIATTPQPPGAA